MTAHDAIENLLGNRQAWYLGRIARDPRFELPIAAKQRISTDVEANLISGAQAGFWQRQAISELRHRIHSLPQGDTIWQMLCQWIHYRITVVEAARDHQARETAMLRLSSDDQDWLDARRTCRIPVSQAEYEEFSLALDKFLELLAEYDQQIARRSEMAYV